VDAIGVIKSIAKMKGQVFIGGSFQVKTISTMHLKLFCITVILAHLSLQGPNTMHQNQFLIESFFSG
jgi:hypothetical protein